MTSGELARRNIAELLDRLGPGLVLYVDEPLLLRAFDWPAATSIEAATFQAGQFATSRGCSFRYDEEASAGLFFRQGSGHGRERPLRQAAPLLLCHQDDVIM